MSTHTLLESLYGRIHTFVLSSACPEGKDPSFSTFIRRIVHYFHNTFVLGDEGDGSHIPDITNPDSARDLFALFVATMFLNVLDVRTYQAPSMSVNQSPHTLEDIQATFDLNAIPVIERHHFCYTRGLVLDLVFWFFDHYSMLNEEEEEVDGYRTILIPFLVHVGQHIIRYKRAAVQCGYETPCDAKQIEAQIQAVLFYRSEMKEEFEKQASADGEAGYNESDIDDPPEKYDMGFDFDKFMVSERTNPTNNAARIADFLVEGQTLADKRFFEGLLYQFVDDENGTKSDFIFCFKVNDIKQLYLNRNAI